MTTTKTTLTANGMAHAYDASKGWAALAAKLTLTMNAPKATLTAKDGARIYDSRSK
jgi:hypothetical protein